MYHMCIPFLSRRPGILPEIRNIRVRKVIGEAIEMYRFGWSGGNGLALHFAALKREPARKEGLVLVTVRGQVTKAITRDSTWNSLIFVASKRHYILPYFSDRKRLLAFAAVN